MTLTTIPQKSVPRVHLQGKARFVAQSIFSIWVQSRLDHSQRQYNTKHSTSNFPSLSPIFNFQSLNVCCCTCVEAHEHPYTCQSALKHAFFSLMSTYQKTPSSVIPDSHCQHLNHLENHTGDFSLISCLVILYPPGWIKTMRSQNEFCTNPITDLVPKARSTLSHSDSMGNRRAAVRQVPEKESTIVVAPDDCCASTSLITATCLCNTCNEIFNLSNWSESIFQGYPRNTLFQHLSQNQ